MADTPMTAHARRELKLAGAFTPNDQGYDGSVGKATLAVVKTFDKFTRGNSQLMETVMMAFTEVVNGNLLTPPSDDPDEWEEMPVTGSEAKHYRNKRSPFYRSTDGGQTWFHQSAAGDVHKSMNHITKEIPEDGPTDIPESSSNTGDGKDSEKSAGSEASSDQAQEAGSGIDPGVGRESEKDPGGSEESPRKSKGRQE